MLSQKEADELIELIKYLQQYNSVAIPSLGEKTQLIANSVEGEFIVDIRRGRIDVFQATFQTRYKKNIPLIRLDLEGPEHQNPDGMIIPCPHLHIYREGFDLKRAFPVETEAMGRCKT
ncbi:hypothetical protein ACE41H_12040 [Paenibacillus enshidis]|uniref:Uncharacterized protein n=1 Tax=Paenibacillus enshidis TaxID=1458439 RepID=A0ABV5AU20_9BACL